jgi:methylthioribose-1-phosphate isomerase
MRTIEWNAERGQLNMIDQRALPARLTWLALESADQVAEAIRSMAVRGAPAIGASAAYGLALTAMHSRATSPAALLAELKASSDLLLRSRPTAINLSWGLRRVLEIAERPASSVDELRQLVLAEAHRIADEDIETNRRMGFHGAELLNDGDTIIHHCNTGALATVDWGTALGVVRAAHEQGKRLHVLVDETRPRLQGSRLTAWELGQMGVSYDIITDNAAGYFLRSGRVNAVLFGADRVAANGDVANKIGTYMLSLAAQANRVPVYAVFPVSTVDFDLACGAEIPIEERSPAEVLDIQYEGEPVSPEGASARNPAFDVTPHDLITAYVTERGVIRPPFSVNLPRPERP